MMATESYTFSGRQPVSIWKKINPIWWFGNDTEQTLAEASWYMPNSPTWLRYLEWSFRNPLQNFRCFVVGVQDRNYTVTGKVPVLTVQRNDLSPPETGFQYCWLRFPIPLGFISYSGKTATWYVGWQPSGFFGVKAEGTAAYLIIAIVVCGFAYRFWPAISALM